MQRPLDVLDIEEDACDVIDDTWVDIPPITHQMQETQAAVRRSFASQELLAQARRNLYESMSGVLQESAEQYRWSIRGVRDTCTRIGTSSQGGMKIAWGFLTQPVWVASSRKAPKQYSRITLFSLDVVRFGGTFAALFVALFVSLNYQSFWAIAQSHLSPVAHMQTAASLKKTVDAALREHIGNAPSLAVAGRTTGDLLSFLPPVGPPENRLIIPRMNLNVPLVTPSYASLIAEDWEAVETDIQDALQYGVVHYPGTARPGQAGNFFVTGHSSYYPWAPGAYKNVFARLHELNVGDEYWVYYGGDKYRYLITGKREVKPTNVDVLDQPIDHRTATLMTCTPVGTTLRRLILTAKEIDPYSGLAMEVGEKMHKPAQRVKLEALPI